MKIERPKVKQPIPPHAEKVFKGIIFDVYQWEQELYDGTKATFEKLKRMDTAVVFPVLDDGRILLVEQSQPGKDPYISGAGGRMEEGVSQSRQSSANCSRKPATRQVSLLCFTPLTPWQKPITSCITS